jgi:mono/diheme cytochrome c family protein
VRLRLQNPYIAVTNDLHRLYRLSGMSKRLVTSTSRSAKLLAVLAGLTIAAGAVAATALAGHAKTPKLVGNAKAGKAIFVSTCGACHKLKAAKTAGTLGPNLDTVKPLLTEVQIIKAITNGGASIMTKKALAKYPTRMVAYKGVLSKAKINNVAAFVYTSTHKK